VGQAVKTEGLISKNGLHKKQAYWKKNPQPKPIRAVAEEVKAGISTKGRFVIFNDKMKRRLS